MKELSQNLFICFVLCCSLYSLSLALDGNGIKYNILDRYNLEEVHKTFNNKKDAEKYVLQYKSDHDYLIQEVHYKK